MIKVVHVESLQFSRLGRDLLRGPHPGSCHNLVSLALGGGRRIVRHITEDLTNEKQASDPCIVVVLLLLFQYQ